MILEIRTSKKDSLTSHKIASFCSHLAFCRKRVGLTKNSLQTTKQWEGPVNTQASNSRSLLIESRPCGAVLCDSSGFMNLFQLIISIQKIILVSLKDTLVNKYHDSKFRKFPSALFVIISYWRQNLL